jgi:TPR repeat protein
MWQISRRAILVSISLVALSACAVPNKPAAYDYDTANRLWWAGRYADAWEMMRPLAEQGDPRAEFWVGCRYIDGRGVPRDDRMAVDWITKAAQGGDAEAQYNLGVVYRDGRRGLSRDPVQARKWLELAAAQDYAPAKSELSTLMPAP